MVKNPSANAGDTRDVGLIPGSGRLLGGGNGNPFQYSCLGNAMVRGAWRTIVHGVAKSQTRVSMSTRAYVSTNTALQDFFLFFFWLCPPCGILVPQLGIKPTSPAVDHWTAMEFPRTVFFFFLLGIN